MRFADKNSSNVAERSTNFLADHRSMDARSDTNANVSRLKDRESANKSEDVKRSSLVKSNSTGSAKDPRVEVGDLFHDLAVCFIGLVYDILR